MNVNQPVRLDLTRLLGFDRRTTGAMLSTKPQTLLSRPAMVGDKNGATSQTGR